MRKLVVILFTIFIIFTMSFSGCLDDSTESADTIDYHPELNDGDKWTSVVNTESWMNMTITIEIEDADSEYNGTPAIKSITSVTIETYENDTFKADDFSGDGTVYFSEENLEIIYQRLELTGTYHYKKYDSSLDVKIITEVNYSFSGKSPDMIEEGDEWTITEKEVSSTTVKNDGQIISHESDADTKTKNYKAVDMTEITVEVGTFDVMKIEWTEGDGTANGTEYYSEEVKNTVKEIEYDEEGKSIIEMIDYSV